MSDRKRFPPLMVYDRTNGHCLTMWSCSEPGGHIARVSASGPNWSWFGPGEVHVPRPRLQSNRTFRVPSAVKGMVYLTLSSGISTAPSPPWNFTSCHEVPPRPSSGACGAICTQPNMSPTANDRVQHFNDTQL